MSKYPSLSGRSKCIAVLVVLGSLVACSGQDSVQIEGTVDGHSFPTAYGKAELRSNEPGGVTIVLRSQPFECNGRSQGDEMMLDFFLVQPGDESAKTIPVGTYAVSVESVVTGGVVGTIFLQEGGALLPTKVESGSITLDVASGDRYAGSFSVLYEGNQELKGDFDVPTCQVP